MMAMDLVLRLLHIIPAIFLAGGVFFMWVTLLPALRSVNDETRESLLSAVRGRWSKVVMACTGLLLVTGIWNAVRNMIAFQFDGPYHVLVAIKLFLALAIFFLTAVLGGRRPLAEKLREKLPFWMAVNTGLLLGLIVIASSMKISPRDPKPEREPVSSTSMESSVGQLESNPTSLGSF